MDKGKKRRTSSRRKRIDVGSPSKATKDSKVASTSSASKVQEKSRPTSPGNNKTVSPEPGTNDAANKSGTSPTRPGASSPEPNCAICLGKLENKSFTDSCFHMFCFVCLVEWSKVKAECPLCKQSFKSIIHNLKSYKEYDQYNIPQPEDRDRLAQMHEFAAPGGLRFRYRTTVTDHRYAHLADRIDQEIQRQLLQRPSRRTPIPNWRRLRQPANSDFRRSVYTQRMQHTGQQSRPRRRVRDTSPSFFASNPAQTHRLVPWLNRELNALLQGQGDHVAFVLELIMGLITRHAIDSVEFHQHVLPYVGRFTHQFQQEFLAFAKSPFHMAAYDRNVTYEPRENAHAESDSDRQDEGAADDGNDSDIIVVSPSNSPQHDTAEPRRAGDGDSDLDPWERSIMTVGNPSYLGFAPIVRSFRQDDLSQALDQAHGVSRRYGLNAPPGISDWDSPTHGASALFGDDTSTAATASTSRQHIIWSPNSGRQHIIWPPTSSSTSAPATPNLPATVTALAGAPALSSWDSDTPWPRPPLPPICETILPASMQSTGAFPPISVWPSTSQNDPIVCRESEPEQSSNESDLEIIDYEKPWTERSPIKLSSGEESDCDVMITGSSYANDPVKTEKKPRRRKREIENIYTSTDEDRSKKRSRGESSDGSRSISKRRHDKSLDPQRTVSRSPMNREEMDYQQSLLSVMMSAKDREKKKRKKRHHEISTCTSSSDSDSRSKHVSIRSRKHRSSSKHSHIEILEYKKKSKKHKKSSKSQRKDGKRDDSSDDDKEKRRKDKYDKYYNKDAEKYDNDKTSSKHSKHKKKKSKDKKHKHKDKSKERVDKPTLPRVDEKSSTITDTSDTDNFYEKFSVVMKEISNIAQRKPHEISDSASDVDIERKSDDATRSSNQTKDVNKKRNKETSRKKSNREQSLKPEVANNATETKMSDHSGYIDNYNLTNKTQENSAFKQPAIDTSQFEFVELSSNQASFFDQELDSVTRSLVDGNLDSFFQSYETSEPKHFKKHPHGHKKSSKKKLPSATFASDHNEETPIPIAIPVADNTIQSNDISSCTDIDASIDYQLPPFLPPFLSFVDKQKVNKSSTVVNTCVQDNDLASVDSSGNLPILLSPEVGLLPDEHTPPTTGQNILEDGTAIVSLPSCDTRRHSSCINVDSISNDSDIDVIGEDNDHTFISIPCYKSSKDTVRLPNSSLGADEFGAKQNDLNRSPKPGYSGIVKSAHDYIDVLGVSESDSDSHVEFIGEEQKKIEITEESDCENGDDVDVINYDSDVDIVGHSEDDIVIDADVEEECSSKQKHNISLLSVDSETESTDLDYHCEEEEPAERNSYDTNHHKHLNKVASDDGKMAQYVDGVNKSPPHEPVLDKLAVDGNKNCDSNATDKDGDVRANGEEDSDTSINNTDTSRSIGKDSEDNIDNSVCIGENAGDALNDTNTSDVGNSTAEVDKSSHSECSHLSDENLHSEEGPHVDRSPNSVSPSGQSPRDEHATDDEPAQPEHANWTTIPSYEPQSPSTSRTDTSPSRAFSYASAESPESSPSALISPPYVATLYESSGSQGYPSYGFPTFPTYSPTYSLYQPSSPDDYYDSLAPED